ncbi:lipoprotein [uncultured Hoeflea sp.]|uniref:LPS translocon maturation chaperone LptM n=1 Tax=uncultured Hoeflea sp. TaxID=538666 RepID=UPI0026073088|nr:lipoprotein [uncultured Hoeflea sp.]
MKTSAVIKSVCIIAALVAILSGCGRKGDLERPSVTAAPVADAAEAEAPQTGERRFILDGLLD